MRISDWSSDVCSSDLHPQDLVDDAIALFVAALDDVAVGLGGHGSEPGLGIGDWGFGKARASGDFAVIGFRTVGHAALANPQSRIPNPAGRLDRKSTRLNSSH